MADFDEAEFHRALGRVLQDQETIDWGHATRDPKLEKDVRDDKLRGNKIERYAQALEGLGMVLVPPQALGLWSDGSPHQEPLWIHPDFDLQVAFSEDDILQLFPGDSGPEDLWNWVKEKQQALAARRAGILLPG